MWACPVSSARIRRASVATHLRKRSRTMRPKRPMAALLSQDGSSLVTNRALQNDRWSAPHYQFNSIYHGTCFRLMKVTAAAKTSSLSVDGSGTAGDESAEGSADP